MTYPWQQNDLNLQQQVDSVLSAMSLQQKFAWLSGNMAIALDDEPIAEGAIGSAGYYPGIPELGIPAMQQSDASLGVSVLGGIRPSEQATALPASLSLAASFNTALAEQSGQLLGREAFAKGFNVQLAGGANLIREPRGGRNFEYLSEDPLLTGLMAGHSVRGIQSQHVVSTLKHFAVNAQETGRVVVSSDISESALRQSDLLAFEIAIEIGKPGSIMTSYNLVNGQWTSENDFLLNQVLKGDWQYPGWVMSDWGATHSSTKAALAGLDVQSGCNLDTEHWFGQPLYDAVERGEVPLSRIDDMVRRILRSLFSVGAIQHPAQRYSDIDFVEHHLRARKIAEQGIVLLKNSTQTLPLARGSKNILVVGAFADKGVPAGGGSSAVTPLDSLKLEGVDFMGIKTPKVYHPSIPLKAIQAESWAETVNFSDGRDIVKTKKLAEEAETVILFADEWRSEALDCQGMDLDPALNHLIDSLSAMHKNVVVILQTGGPVLMPWIDNVNTIIQAWYSGSAGAEAIAGVLFGRVNPCGRLPVTFPASEQQLPRPQQIDPTTTTSMPATKIKGGIIHIDYDKEGSDVGYRWYQRTGQQPLFPFGYGLSYTQFAYQQLSVAVNPKQIRVNITVINTGKRDGADVVQLYIQPKDNSYPARLAAFQRIELQRGEKKSVQLILEPKVIANWQSEQQQWKIAAGTYQIIAGRFAGDNQISVDTELSEKVMHYR